MLGQAAADEGQECGDVGDEGRRFGDVLGGGVEAVEGAGLEAGCCAEGGGEVEECEGAVGGHGV